MKQTNKIIGIDLGTTNSCVAIIENKKPKIIPTAEGNTVPSVVSFKGDEIIVGQSAKNQVYTNPNTIVSIKRKMGTKEKITVNGKEYTPQQISAMVLQKMKQAAEDYLGMEVKRAVITVPAYFNDGQRQATRDAGEIAGLKVERIINEPTAAALAYETDRKKNEKVLVFDLGGGTFDVSLLELDKDAIEVIATSGDNHLGGDDFDNKIVDHLAKMFQQKHKVNLKTDKLAMQRLKEAAEKAKKDLSGTLETTISQPFISMNEAGPLHLEEKLTRAQFEDMTKDLVLRTIKPIKQAFKDANLKHEDVDEILLVGGSTKMPMVIDTITRELNKKPNRSVHPDEVVALGAAVQGGIIGGDVDSVTLLDVTPLSLGIETLGGAMTRLIERNTTIPISKSQVFSTAADNQPAVDIHILQGEREMAADNNTLGRFQLSGIKPSPRGVPQIEVKFNIDVNGIVHVSAKDKGTNKEQSITIKDSSGLTKEQIDKMVEDAQKFKEEDKKRREEVELKNKAQQFLFSIEGALNDPKQTEKMDKKQKEETEKLRDEIKVALDKNDFKVLKEKIAALENAAKAMASFQQQNPNFNPEDFMKNMQKNNPQHDKGKPKPSHPNPKIKEAKIKDTKPSKPTEDKKKKPAQK